MSKGSRLSYEERRAMYEEHEDEDSRSLSPNEQDDQNDTDFTTVNRRGRNCHTRGNGRGSGRGRGRGNVQENRCDSGPSTRAYGPSNHTSSGRSKFEKPVYGLNFPSNPPPYIRPTLDNTL